MKNYAIIGFGGMGKTHFQHLRQLEEKRGDIQLVAICNSDIESITKNISLNFGNVNMSDIDFSRYGLYTDYKEMLEKEKIDFVFISLPSYLHAEVSIYCLNHGVDVFTEKPMAITLEQCTAMMEAAKNNGRRLMVGQVLRFISEYKFLKDAVDTKKYGKAVKAEFYRKSALPAWSFGNWMLKEDKSGGCVVDMHVHDVDMMVWLFGKPSNISILSTHQKAEFESVFGLYQYPELAVQIVGDWGLPATFAFETGYSVTFEKALIEYKNNKLKVYTDEKSEEVSLNESNGHYEEIEEFVRAVVDGEALVTVDTQSVYETMEVVFAEKKIAKDGVIGR